MIREKNAQSVHDTLIAKMAKDFQERGFTVMADHVEGHCQPANINGYIPDLIASKDGRYLIYEIETRDTVNSKHAKDQKEAFERFIKGQGDMMRFEQIIAD